MSGKCSSREIIKAHLLCKSYPMQRGQIAEHWNAPRESIGIGEYVFRLGIGYVYLSIDGYCRVGYLAEGKSVASLLLVDRSYYMEADGKWGPSLVFAAPSPCAIKLYEGEDNTVVKIALTSLADATHGSVSDSARFPHTCHRCGNPAYIGLLSIDCSVCNTER